jgi:hypothetical protein
MDFNSPCSILNSVSRFEFFQPIAVLAAARYWGAATTDSLLSPKRREPRNTPNTRKDDITAGGFVSVCSVCSVVMKNGIATQTQDHLPNRVGLFHRLIDHFAGYELVDLEKNAGTVPGLFTGVGGDLPNPLAYAHRQRYAALRAKTKQPYARSSP